MTEPRWMDPPDTVRRFTWNQIGQHWAASALWVLLVATAVFPGPSSGAAQIHSDAGIVSAVFLLGHLVTLVAIGIRKDVSPERVAFFPTGREWTYLRRPGQPYPAGKYSPEEKGDYLAILAWSILLTASGILLHWPGSLGVPDAAAYGWLRVIHAGCGAALSLHVLLIHVPGRWLRAAPSFRQAIFTGMVPRERAEKRDGWISELMGERILIPVPREETSETDRESEQVRTILEEGNRLVREGKFGEAAEAFEGALALYPGYSQARFNLGVARWKEGKEDLAEEQFRRFIETDPFNPMAEKAREILGGMLRKRDGEGR